MENIELLTANMEVTLAWSRRIRFVYKRKAAVEATLSWDNNYGYALEIRSIEVYAEDASEDRDITAEVQEWVDGLSSGELHELAESVAAPVC